MTFSAVPVPEGLDPRGRWLSRISSRSALLADFSLALNAYTPGASFRSLIVEGNVCLKPTTASRRKVYKELKGRYLIDKDNPYFTLFMREWKAAPDDEAKAQTIYVFFCLNDRTVLATSSEWLCPKVRSAPSELRIGDLENFLRKKSDEHPEIRAWSANTLTCVAQKYLASIRDFGFATGTSRKISRRPSVSGVAFRFLVKSLLMSGVGDRELISHPAFRILGFAGDDIVETLIRLNRDGLIRFRMQADVIEIAEAS